MVKFIKKWLEDRRKLEEKRLTEDVYCMAIALSEHFKMMGLFQGMAPNLFPSPKMSANDAMALCEEMREGCKRIYNVLQHGGTLTIDEYKNLSTVWKEFYMTINDIESGLSRGVSSLGGGTGNVPSPMARYRSLKNQGAIADGI